MGNKTIGSLSIRSRKIGVQGHADCARLDGIVQSLEGPMRIQDIMTREPRTVTPNATVREAAQVMKRENVGIVPVIEGDDSRKLVGVVTDRDIAIRCIAEGRGADCRVREVMSGGDVATCGADDEVDSVMTAMRSERVRRIPIIDDRGTLVGIVSQADIALRMKNDSQVGETVQEISQPGGRHAH